MLESLMSFGEIYEKPWKMFIWAFIMGSIGIIISLQVSYRVIISGIIFNLTGLFSVIFSIIPAVYFVTHLIKKEELIEERRAERHADRFWERHEKDILILLFHFLGLSLAFSLWSFVLPQDVFQIQLTKINQIRGGITGSAIDKGLMFNKILFNNIQVMIFSFLFSFIFGAGAIFIITWNASIFGVFVGSVLSEEFWHIPVVTMSYLPHAIPEIGGYLSAALGGGILSAAILRRNRCAVMKTIFIDSLKLLALGIALLVIAAFIEVYV